MSDVRSLLEVKDIIKNFPGVQALKGVTMDVRAGEVHALVGENGAGKSTLMKCLIGIHPPTSGEIYYDGEVRDIKCTQDALNIGISMIHQELSPVLHRSIMENIWLGREPRNKLGLIDHKKMYIDSVELLKRIEVYDDPRTLMVDITVAKMQMVEIAKAISYNSKLVIMDEPTSSLTEREVKQLFKIINQLKEDNIGIIYISHKMDEIFTITDRISVFRDGEYIDTKDTKDFTMEDLINMMVGREIKELYSKEIIEQGEVMLEVNNLCGRKFNNVSFKVRKGEILGMAGLVGAGRTEVVETLFGIREKLSGDVYIHGEKVDIKNSRDAIAKKMALLTEERRATGIFPVLNIEYNMAVANMKKYINKLGLINYGKLKSDCDKYVGDINIKTPGLWQQIQFLSGGNQQKVLVARWLLTEPDILFLDEPTRGIDVGAKAEIYKLIEKLAKMGKCIIMISSELPEIIGMSDRVLVMHEGRVTGILDRSEISQEIIMSYATSTMEANALS